MKLFDTVSLSYATDSLEVCIISDKNCKSVVFLEGLGAEKKKNCVCICVHALPFIFFDSYSNSL